MKIAGIQKTSFIDYPGELATVLFTSGCNFRCPYCHNSELLNQNYELEDKDWIQWLKSRQKNIDAIVISGGEPTLHSDLIEFLRKLKQEGFKVKLDTNGSNPKMLRQIIQDELVDYVAMDLKGPASVYLDFSKDVEMFERIKESADLIIKTAPDYEFRTTITEELLNDHDFEECIDIINGAKKFYLQKFRDGDQVLAGKGNLNCVNDEHLKSLETLFTKRFDYFKIR
ncbi:MAG: anaerobic ribonucleoside-triphosphate reductase activating protein [Tissierellales bacterium]|jgi:pyruvate formate lyase activating enzyme|nr:anaerobic ribonucleoside-triphosphate reductase activating protein [Tissierellales bacterium]